MNADETVARVWMAAVFERLYAQFKARHGVNIRNFGRFFLRPGSTWTF